MSFPRDNDTVSLVFTATLDNGEVFFEAKDDKPFSVTIGKNELPPSLEEAIKQMTAGENRKVRIPPEEGYGQRHKDLIQVIENPEMVKKLNPKPGMVLSLKVEREGEEQVVPATVTEVDGTKVTVDYNHPLAGHHLNYDLTLKEVHSSAG